MAILKHITSKNADYGKAFEYLIFKHNEFTGKAILDESGSMVMREEYYMDGINCEPSTFDIECEQLNEKWKKNQHYNEIKSHHYIISFDPKDVTENGLTGERAQQLGLAYARKNFPGHQALVCTHTDGHNASGNIHVHIVINSLRKFDVEKRDFMERPCDSLAGYKHHQTRDYLIYLKKEVMEMCRHENLHQTDLLTPAEKKITEKEYHARRRGQQKMDERNRQMISGGIAPRRTVYQTQKDELRVAIDDAAANSRNLEEFQDYLSEKHRITLRISRGRFSYLHPDRQKAVTGRMLGSCYEKEYLQKKFEENADQSVEGKEQSISPALSRSPASTTQQNTNAPFTFIKTNLRLVKDLQQCVKAQQSRAYARRVKLTNLKQMADTISYIQEHSFDTRQDLMAALSGTGKQAGEMRAALRATEQQLKEVNEQIHYTGQYLSTKDIYSQYLKSRRKKHFQQEHQTEILLYETARNFLKEHSNTGRFTSMKLLKNEKERLAKLKDSQYAAYKNLRGHHKELKTICANVDMILEKKRELHNNQILEI